MPEPNAEAPTEVKPDVARAIAIVGEIPFAGRAVARALMEHGVAARVLCPDEESELAISSLPGQERAEIIKGCIESEESIGKVLAGSGGVCFISPVNMHGRMYRGAEHLEDVKRVLHSAELLLLRKFVYHSSVGADEKALSKALRDAFAAEELLSKSRCEDYFIRTGPLMGPGDRFLSEFAESAHRASPVMTIVGYGGAQVQPLHVDDFAKAIARIFAGSQETLRNGKYQLVGNELHTLMELADAALAISRRRKLKIHAPKFALQLVAALTGSSAIRERVALENDILATDKNEFPRLMGDDVALKGVREVQEALARR